MFGEGPGCVSLAETIVRLVKEGQMEEPNEKMFKTPRKVLLALISVNFCSNRDTLVQLDLISCQLMIKL